MPKKQKPNIMALIAALIIIAVAAIAGYIFITRGVSVYSFTIDGAYNSANNPLIKSVEFENGEAEVIYVADITKKGYSYRVSGKTVVLKHPEHKSVVFTIEDPDTLTSDTFGFTGRYEK